MLVGLCEDEPATRRLLDEAMRIAGHETLMAHNGGEGLRLFGTHSGVDVIVLDVGLPDADGRDVCQALRSSGQNAPVLFLTALSEIHDRLAGYAAGGDDYVAKPFDLRELHARLDALARRGRLPPFPPTGLTLDLARHSICSASAAVLLTPTEFRILAVITSRPDEVARRSRVLAAAWPDGAYVASNTLDSLVRRIRLKLESIDSPVSIETVRGIGYRLT